MFHHTETEYKLIPGRKRIQRPADDSSSDEGGAIPPALSVKEKEDRLVELRIAEPEYEPMVSREQHPLKLTF